MTKNKTKAHGEVNKYSAAQKLCTVSRLYVTKLPLKDPSSGIPNKLPPWCSWTCRLKHNTGPNLADFLPE